MKTLSLLTILIIVLGFASCDNREVDLKADQKPGTPSAIKKLEVTGSRTKANVRKNMTPLVNKMVEIYKKHQAKNPELKGTIELRLVVEFNGEVQEIKIIRTTISDENFLKDVIRPIEFTDFDGWGNSEDETEILCTIEFKLQ